MQLHKIGRFADAARLYRQVARLEPRNVEALRLLGSVRMRQDNFAEAERAFRKAVKIDARSADAHIELGVVLCRLGRLADAVSSYQRAIELKPDYAGAHNNLGITLRELGRLDEAIASYLRATELEPGYAEAHYNLGNALNAAGRLDEAVTSYRAAIAIKPDYAGAHVNLGNNLRQAGRFDEAAGSYRRAVEIAPGYAEAHRNLGIVQFERNQFDEAIANYRAALAVKPDYAEASADLGNALRTLGRLDEARHAFEEAVRLAPEAAGFYHGLADSKRFAAGDQHLAAMEKLARNLPALADEDQIRLHFALAKAFADLAEYKRSFRQLLTGNRLKRRQVSYDEPALLSQFERIRAVFTPALVQDKRGLGDPSPVPIFVIGMPRSGTTLVEQILASHPAVHGAGELSDFYDAVARLAVRESITQPYPGLVSEMTGPRLFDLGADYLSHVGSRAPTAERITDKMPGNFVAAGFIHLALPNARIIHIRRDPIDTCLSCFATLFAANQPFAYDLGELGRYYRAYAALMDHWRGVLPEGVMIEVQYEDVVADVEREARRIVAHCGLDWNDACLAFHRTQRPVRTASMVQVRQPIYQSSIGRWRPYKDMLGPLVKALRGDPIEGS